MTILVSRSWPPEHPTLPIRRAGEHPHRRGSGNYFTFPDEMWHAAQEVYLQLEPVSGSLVRYEWVKGFPGAQYLVSEGAVCSLDDKPHEFLPALVVDRDHPRRAIRCAPGPDNARERSR